MTSEPDVELHERLAALAAAVPVEAPGGMTVVSPHMRTGQTGRRFALGGFVPLIAVLVIATVGAGLAKLGPFAPGTTQGGNGPVTSTNLDGQFELTVRSAKARYTVSEPLEIEATLVYRGAGDVVISHAQGAPVPGRGSVDGPDTGGIGGPLGFGIVEPVIGDLVLGPSWAESCERTTLVRDVPLTVPFAKSGGFSGSNPRADEYRAYMLDPVLRLQIGTWHVYVIAEFSLGECGGEQHSIRAEIAIEMAATPAQSVEPTDEPTISNGPTGGPTHEAVVGVSTAGPYSLEIRADRRTYHESDPITVAATLNYAAGAPPITIRHGANGPIGFGIVEPVLGIELAPIWLTSCNLSELQPGWKLDARFNTSGGISGSDPQFEVKRAYLQDPIRLPPGTWHIYVVANFTPGDCGSDGPELRAEIEIEVLPDEAPSIEP